MKELRAILGLFRFYGRFIQDFKKTEEPLYKLLRKECFFTKDSESALEQLKQALANAPIMGYPNDTVPYTLVSNASLFGIVAIISQRQQWLKELLHT